MSHDPRGGVVEAASFPDAVAGLDEWIELVEREDLTDGLPVYPPERSRVERLLEAVDRNPDDPIGALPPRDALATTEVVAANAVMAGCSPAELIVVLTALEAMLDPTFNLRGVVTTTHGCWPLVIVSGAAVDHLGMGSAESYFTGGGVRANVAIGRAIKLALWNVGGGRPGEQVKEVMGHPGRFGFCVAEALDSPWEPLHEARGVSAPSGVTVFACEAPHSVAMWGAGEGVDRLDMAADAMTTRGNNNTHTMGQSLVVLTPNEARLYADLGLDRAAVQERLFERARRRLGDLLPTGDPYAWWPDWVDTDDPDTLVPVVAQPGDIHMLVGGPVSIPWMAVCPGWGNLGGYAVSRELPER